MSTGKSSPSKSTTSKSTTSRSSAASGASGPSAGAAGAPTRARPATRTAKADGATATPPRRRAAAATPAQGAPSAQDRHAWISEAAYYRAQQRGFVPGRELEDWCAAEAELEARAAQPT